MNTQIPSQRRKLLIALEASALSMLFAGMLCAQTVIPVATGTATTTAPAPTAPVVPSVPSGSFVGACVSAMPQSSPKPFGCGFIAVQTKLGNGEYWSATGYDLTLAKHGLSTTLWSTVALPATTPWNTKVFLIAAPGLSTAATSSGTATGMSFSGGVLCELPRAAKPKWWGYLLPILVGPAVTKGSNVSTISIKVVWGLTTK